MLKAEFKKYQLQFKRPAGTSRGVYKVRDCWFIRVWNTENPDVFGWGECAPLPDLSCDALPNYETILSEVCTDINRYEYWIKDGLVEWPSIRFGLETAILDLNGGGKRILFDMDFAEGRQTLTINGLIWMGDVAFMKEQIALKLQQGFRCVKMKIGAIDWENELAILKEIRKSYSADILELRVDANGAFAVNEVQDVLKQLSELDIHSIEQPIKQGQWKEMAALCASSPVGIALDEELIGVHDWHEKNELLDTIKPQYIILKPSLHGGLKGSGEWIKLAEERNIDWWITSALESNIGLNAIAQYTALFDSRMPQGLGTGQLFVNNFESPLTLDGDQLRYDTTKEWTIDLD
ncbi:o-succinylbenzoate synthase [Prolixibacteraceae bacterium JC049]|nr:o-succinylbenzoate synthase [Prolixibacteraceae bacterium JC049]